MTAAPSARDAQQSAARPARSAWVSANAGSGKTRVLTERVARLLLNDADPGKILCLTYTKAAAAEMQSRLFDMLGGWAMAEDDALAASLAELTGAAFPADGLDKARRLFAQALETPGGLKIQTIHAFCDRILRRFPLEAETPPGFRVMEPREQGELIAEVLNDMADGEDDAKRALAAIAADRNEAEIEALAASVIAKRALFAEPPDGPAIARTFGVPFPPDADAARRAAIEAMDMSALARMVAAWRAGSATEVKRAETFSGAEGDLAILAGRLIGAVLTATGAPRAKLANKAAQAAEPDHEALTTHLVDIALAAREAELAATAAARAVALSDFGHRLTTVYEARKRRGALLDFDDLVGKARTLLTRSDACAWVLYRLDGGVDHILVDEAQDTSRAQWDVINEIAKEFRAGLGARDEVRTSFVVGDEKQSIYRFQGAAPEMFAGMRAEFAAALEPLGGQVEEELAHSFRSAPAILCAVDAVFDGEAAQGLTAAGAATAHRAFHDGRAGRVELWPLMEPDDDPPPPEPWAPVDAPTPRSARLKLVEKTVARIAEMLDGGVMPGAGGRRIAPDDIIVLLRARAPMMQPLVRGLKAAGVPVAGADRLQLAEELAVKDLLALLAFASTPADDLSLAALLRSPLFEISEEELFDVAWDRPGPLWPAYRAKGDPSAVERLEAAMAGIGFRRPYEIMQTALVEWGGRRRFLERLGPEAEDAIDELLAEALAFETRETPTAEAFLAHMAAVDFEVRREQEGRGGEVRVMTVHGAKGLEAPIVILPDTVQARKGVRDWRVAALPSETGPVAAAPGPKTADTAALAALRAEEERQDAAEMKRLLYVAMTRAEHWLIVAGAGDDDEAKLDGTWYQLVRGGLRRAEADADADGGLILEDEGAGAPEPDKTGRPAAPHDPPNLSGPPPGVVKTLRRAASELIQAPPAPTGGGLAPDIAARVGDAIHALLEADDAPDAAQLAARHDVSESNAAHAIAEAAAARALPDAAAFFAPGAIAEAGVSAEIGGIRVAGRIDRLIVEETRIAFVDFKSTRAPPAKPDGTPDAFLAQLAAYRDALREIYPEKSVEAYILWTAIPRLDQLDDGRMDAALARALSGAGAP